MQIHISGRTVDVAALATSDIVNLYNELAGELGESSVNRFATRSKAESRLVSIADRHADMVRAKCGTEAPTNPKELLKHHVTGAIERGEAEVIVEHSVTPPVEVSLTDGVHTDPVHVTQTITPSADGHSVTVDTQVTVQLTDLDAAQLTAETQGRAPAVEGAPRWAKAKHEPASRVAYRPRPNSSQAVMYALLTRPDGILIEAFCDEMLRFNDKTLHQPSTVWSCLRYLFVTSKGYGLNFDGQRLKLIVPKDERDPVRTKTAA